MTVTVSAQRPAAEVGTADLRHDATAVIDAARRRARRRRRRTLLATAFVLAVAVAAIVIARTRHSDAETLRGADSATAAVAAVCPASGRVVDLSSLRRWSSRAPGTAPPDIASYGGTWPNDDPRNFVAQVSGKQALAANLNPGRVGPTDRVVVLVSYNSIIRLMSKPLSFPESAVTQVYAARIDMQDITTGAPPMTQGLRVAGCLK